MKKPNEMLKHKINVIREEKIVSLMESEEKLIPLFEKMIEEKLDVFNPDKNISFLVNKDVFIFDFKIELYVLQEKLKNKDWSIIRAYEVGEQVKIHFKPDFSITDLAGIKRNKIEFSAITDEEITKKKEEMKKVAMAEQVANQIMPAKEGNIVKEAV